MKKRVILFVLLLCLLMTFGCSNGNSSDKLRIYAFSAGAADAFLLMTEEGAVLIDAGEKDFGKELVSYLEANGISELEYLIVTHFDKDHVGGAAKILHSVPVRHVLQSNCPKDSDEYDNYLSALADMNIEPVTVQEELSFSLGSSTFTVDPPNEDIYAEEASNNSSLIVSVTCGACGFLFMGDAETMRIREFLQTQPGSFDFLKMPHHGRWDKALPELLDAVQPGTVIITSSEEEPEDAKTVALLESCQTEIYLTRIAPILLTCDGEQIKLRYQVKLNYG